MASTLELLIRAKLDATGLNQLETQLTKVTDTVSKMMASGQRKYNAADFILSDGDVDSVRASVEEIDAVIQDLKGRIINAFATGGDEAVQQFEAQMKRLQTLKKTLTTAIGGTESFRTEDFVLNTSDMIRAAIEIKKLEKEITDFERSATAAFARGNKSAQAYFQGMAKEAKRAKKELEAIAPDASTSFLNPDNFIGRETDINDIKNRISGLTDEIENLTTKARAAYAEQQDDAAKAFMSQAAGLKQQRSELEKTIPVVEKTGDAIQNLLTNRITRLGFGIFAIQSSIQTFTTLIGGMFDTIAEGAATLDRTKSFEILLTGEGIDPTGMASRLREASQGLLTLDQAMQKTIQLAKAGFPEMAQNSDALLKIATNAAIVSGDVNQAATVYDKLVRGIIRGSPRLIDDADIILKLGDANEQYAESLGKTVEELTAAEKVQATYNAVLQEGLRINEMAEQMDSTSVKVQKLKTDWEEFTQLLKESVAIVVISNEEMKESFDDALDIETLQGAGIENATMIVTKFFTTLKGFGALIGITFAVAKKAVVSIWQAFRLVGDALVWLVEQAARVGASFGRMAWNIVGATKAVEFFDKQIAELDTGIANLETSMANRIDILGQGITDEVDQILKAAGLIRGEIQRGQSIDIPTDTTVVDKTKETNDEIQKLLRERAKMSADIEHERTSRVRDINRDHANKMKDIAQDLADKLRDIKQDLNDKLLDLAQDRAEKLADIDRDLADKLQDINEDLADKLSDIQSDSEQKKIDAIDDYNKAKEDAEKAHQKRINDILRQYEASRLQALIDRDARGLFEAEKKRDEDLKDAEETAAEKREAELEELREKLKDIEEAEEKAREDAIKRAEEQRKDAIEAAEKKRRDAQKAYERARRDAELAAERQRRDARQAAAKARQDALESQREAREDLRQWYADKLRDLQSFHADELSEYSGAVPKYSKRYSGFLQ